MSSDEPFAGHQHNDLQVPWDKVHKVRFVAVGFSLGVAESLLLYPLDTLKTNLQADASLKVTHSPLEAAKSLIKSSGGVRALYRGFWVSNIGTAPATLLYLSVYNEMRSFGSRLDFLNPSVSQIVVPFVAGATADLCSLAVYTPSDVLITHMQRGHGRATYSGSFAQVVRQLYAREGVRGFFRGFLAAALCYTPTSALWWPVYEMSKRAVGPMLLTPEEMVRMEQEMGSDGKGKGRLAAVVAISGFLAGGVAYGASNPLDLVRTRLVLQQETYRQTNPLRVLAAVAKHEGVRALFKGVVPRVAAAAPASALGSFTYELALRLSLVKT